MTIKRHFFYLTSFAAMAVAMTITAQAQTIGTAPVADDVSDDDSIVVTGSRPIAESEAAALEIQKNSDSLISVAASDSVGRLPDQNIAQAASRLPGVAVQRDQGQARYINLRGAPKTWTTISLDGLTIVSPEGRDSRFDSIPSALASKIIVRKAVTPNMTGETIAGNVDIITRTPFDYPDGKIALKAGAGHVEYGSRMEYEGSAVASKRFDTNVGEIGVLLAGSYYKRDMITDNFENDWEAVAQDQQPGFFDRKWARETENKLYRLTRKNYSVSGMVDFRPDDDNRIFVQSLYTAFTDDEARDNFIFDLDDRQNDNTRGTAPCTIAFTPTPRNTGYADVCIGNTPLTGTVYGIDINQRATLRAFKQSVQTNTLGGDHKFGDWEMNWRANYTRSLDDRSVVLENRYESPSTRNLRPSVMYDLTDPNLARLRLFSTIANLNGTFQTGAETRNIETFVRPLVSAVSADLIDVTTAYTGKLDLAYNTGWFGGETKLAFGLQYDQRTKDRDESEFRATTAAQFGAAGIPVTYLPSTIDQPFQGKIPLSYDFRYFDTDAFKAYAKSLRGVVARTPLIANNFNVEEEILAGYVMATSKFDWGSIVGGVRVERIKNVGNAIATITTAAIPASGSNPAVPSRTILQPVSVSSDSTLFFPSVHLNYNWDDDKKLRIGFTTGAARPDYDELRPNFVVNDASQSISAGNPNATAEKAWGVDAYAEWYIQPRGFASIGVFYKRAKDVLFDTTRTYGSDLLDSNGVDRSNYQFSAIANGGSGYIYGVEGAIQLQLEAYTTDLGLPDWMGGFGLSANATLNKSRATRPDGQKVSFPGTSDAVYNIGAYYEKYGLSLRLNYQKRTDWLDELGAFGAVGAVNTEPRGIDGGDFYWATDDELDFSARYAVNQNIEVYFDASNLLNNPGRRFVDQSQYTIEWERFGRRYTSGVRVNF